VHAGSGDRPEHEEQRTLEPAADPAQLDDRRGEDDDRSLDRDVAVPLAGKIAGAISLLCWIAVVVCGRFTAYYMFP